jgi:lysophospholipase L1-like esterase
MLGAAYRNLAPDLILLEFGGNVIPYIEDEKESSDYGNWFKSQIKFLKNLNPKSAFLVIGPADTSIKVQTEFITHPMLEPVRDALYKAAMETGCMYFDMYEVMGGKNTMPKWVSADPPLAAPDYIHFSRLGAQKMAEILVEKLMDRYTEFKNAQAVNRSSDSIENLSQHEKNP